jgi:hypothetical protein
VPSGFWILDFRFQISDWIRKLVFGVESKIQNPNSTRASALSLLVLFVLADDANDAFSLDDLALVTDFFNAGSNFHVLFASMSRPEDRGPGSGLPMIVPDVG